MGAVSVSESITTGFGELSRYSEDDERIRVGFSTGATYSSRDHSVQTGSGAYEASNPMDTRGSFPRDRATEAWS
jgi:hypothetical protein